jgi:hypothetical protein
LPRPTSSRRWRCACCSQSSRLAEFPRSPMRSG